jgi:hypothetical protein
MQSAIIPIGLRPQRGLQKHKSKTDILRKEAIRFVDEQWKPDMIKDKMLRNMMKTEYIRRFRLEVKHKCKRKKNKILVDKFLKRRNKTLKGLTYKEYRILLKRLKGKKKTRRRKHRRRGRCTRRTIF